MSELFDLIHDSVIAEERNYPATIEEFVEFGLEQSDYEQYIALQQRLQNELLRRDWEAEKTAANELLSFCNEKQLSLRYDSEAGLGLMLCDAEYFAEYNDWLHYPKSNEDFRLAVERKLSCRWDEVDAFLTDLFGAVSFEYDKYSGACVDFDSPVRLKKYNLDTECFDYLSSDEVRKMCGRVEKELRKAQKEIEAQLACKPKEHDTNAISAGLPWVKKLYELIGRRDVIEEALSSLEEAAKAPDIYKFKETDTLTVFCDADTCKEEGHLVKPIKVDFAFYTKPNKAYTIERCSHCMQFRMSLTDLSDLFDNYGVPKCRIVYDDEAAGDFDGFSETSVLYNMGYTVSQSVGLSAAKRQSILKSAIDTGKLSKYEVLSFLKQRMNINGMKAGNEIAFRKWHDDYEYIKNL